MFVWGGKPPSICSQFMKFKWWGRHFSNFLNHSRGREVKPNWEYFRYCYVFLVTPPLSRKYIIYCRIWLSMECMRNIEIIVIIILVGNRLVCHGEKEDDCWKKIKPSPTTNCWWLTISFKFPANIVSVPACLLLVDASLPLSYWSIYITGLNN